MPEKLLNIKEVSSILGLPESEVEHLVEIGEIPAYRIGGTFLRFRKEQIDAIKMEIARIEEKRASPLPEAGLKPKEPSTYSDVEYDYTFIERIKDFIYFHDFYILSLGFILFLLYVIFRR